MLKDIHVHIHKYSAIVHVIYTLYILYILFHPLF